MDMSAGYVLDQVLVLPELTDQRVVQSKTYRWHHITYFSNGKQARCVIPKTDLFKNDVTILAKQDEVQSMTCRWHHMTLLSNGRLSIVSPNP